MKIFTLLFSFIFAISYAQTQNITFNDPNFKQALIGYGVDTSGDGEISRTEAAAVTILNVGGRNISDMTEIANFTSLEQLACYGNPLSSLDVSKLTNLEILHCYNTDSLTSLNVSGLMNLRELICYSSSLTSLDVSGLTSLETLECQYSSLTNLNVSGATNLKRINCLYNSLMSLDVSGLTKLEELTCNNNVLIGIDLRNTPALSYLFAESNPDLMCLVVDDVSMTPATTRTDQSPPPFTTESCLSQIYAISFNDPDFKQALIDAGVDTGMNGEISLMEAAAVTILDVAGNNISDMTEISYFTSLEYLDCSDNSLSSLDVSELTNLERLYCISNSLTSLVVDGLTKLKILSCSDNSLSSLNVSSLANLEQLVCYSNTLTSLDLSSFVNLEQLSCYNNSLTSLDVSGMTNLEQLSCYNNSLTSLDVSGLTNLSTLVCENNSLTNLNVSGLGRLVLLSCFDNSLTSLDVSGLASLTKLWCYNNALTGIDLRSTPSLNTLLAESNPDLMCLVVNDVSMTPATTRTDQNPPPFTTESCLTQTQNIAFNDPNFKQALINYGVDTSGDGEISRTEAAAVTILNVAGRNISDMTEIAYFTSLEQLSCHGNPLSSLVVSGLTNLERLHCYNTDSLTSLNVSGLMNLKELICYSSSLTSLDVSGLTSLETLECHYSSLTNLNVSGATNLKRINCLYNSLMSLDVSGLTKLEELTCNNNALIGIDLRNTLALSYLFAVSNPDLMCLVVDDVSMTPPITQTDQSPPPFTTHSCLQLTPNITFNDARFKQALIDAGVDGGDGEISEAEAAAVINIDISSYGISDMTEITYFTSLEYLDCSDNSLTSLDVSGLANLEILFCHDNELIDIDLRSTLALSYLDARSNPNLMCMIVDDVSMTPATTQTDQSPPPFTTGSCLPQTPNITFNDTRFKQALIDAGVDSGDGEISEAEAAAVTTLDVSSYGISDMTEIIYFTSLEYLNCSDNSLMSLDVSGLTNLEILVCSYNSLTSLDVSGLTGLEVLDCSNTSLTSLKVSGLTGLEILSCSDNSLVNLDVSGLTSLEELSCSDNALIGIDLRNTPALFYLDANSNPDLMCLVVDDVSMIPATTQTDQSPPPFTTGSCLKPSTFESVDKEIEDMDLPSVVSSILRSTLRLAEESCSQGSGWTARSTLTSLFYMVQRLKKMGRISFSEAGILQDQVRELIQGINSGEISCTGKRKNILDWFNQWFGYNMQTLAQSSPYSGNTVPGIASASREVAVHRIYPNPTNGRVNFARPEPSVMVYDMLGKVIMKSTNTAHIDLTHVQPGVYVIRLGTGDSVVTKKIVKE